MGQQHTCAKWVSPKNFSSEVRPTVLLSPHHSQFASIGGKLSAAAAAVRVVIVDNSRYMALAFMSKAVFGFIV